MNTLRELSLILGLYLVSLSTNSIAESNFSINGFEGFKWGTNSIEISKKLGLYDLDRSTISTIVYSGRHADIDGFKVIRKTFGLNSDCPTYTLRNQSCRLEYGAYAFDLNEVVSFDKLFSRLVDKYGEPIEYHSYESFTQLLFPAGQDTNIEIIDFIYPQKDGGSVILTKEVSKIDFITTSLVEYKKGMNNIQVIYLSPQLNHKRTN